MNFSSKGSLLYRYTTRWRREPRSHCSGARAGHVLRQATIKFNLGARNTGTQRESVRSRAWKPKVCFCLFWHASDRFVWPTQPDRGLSSTWKRFVLGGTRRSSDQCSVFEGVCFRCFLSVFSQTPVCSASQVGQRHGTDEVVDTRRERRVALLETAPAKRPPENGREKLIRTSLLGRASMKRSTQGKGSRHAIVHASWSMEKCFSLHILWLNSVL